MKLKSEVVCLSILCIILAVIQTAQTAVDLKNSFHSLTVVNNETTSMNDFHVIFPEGALLCSQIKNDYCDCEWTLTCIDNLPGVELQWATSSMPVDPGDSVLFAIFLYPPGPSAPNTDAYWTSDGTTWGKAPAPHDTYRAGDPLLGSDDRMTLNGGPLPGTIESEWCGFTEMPDDMVIRPRWALSPTVIPLDSLYPGNPVLEGLVWQEEEQMTLGPDECDSFFIPYDCTATAVIVTAALTWANVPADTLAYSIHQSQYTTVDVSTTCLTPSVTPGDTLKFMVNMHNEMDKGAFFDAWIDVKLPNGHTIEKFMIHKGIKLPPHHTHTRELRIKVPQNAPLGTYTHTTKVGYINFDCDSCRDSFNFEVIGP